MAMRGNAEGNEWDEWESARGGDGGGMGDAARDTARKQHQSWLRQRQRHQRERVLLSERAQKRRREQADRSALGALLFACDRILSVPR